MVGADLAKQLQVLQDKLPPDYRPDDVKTGIKSLGGMGKPLNICLKQEIDRLQKVISTVRFMLAQLKLAIAGTIVMSPELAEAPVATTAAPLAYLTFTRPLPEEPWSRWSLPDALSLQHSSANFCFARDTSVQLRVAEHMLSCGAGYTVPRATLRMLTEEVRRRVQTGRDTDETSERDGADDGEMDPWRLVGCLSTAGWRHLLGWLEQALAQLHGAFQHAHGFKASTLKTSQPAVYAARRVSDCLPEPPTPTSSAEPRGVRMMRLIRMKWSSASLKSTRSTAHSLFCSLKRSMNICTRGRTASSDAIGS